MTDESLLPRSVAVLEAGMRRKVHVGAQLHVALRGRTEADIALGLAAPNRLLELLRCGGELAGVRLLTPQTAEAMTARHRTGLPGEDYPLILDRGLGLALDSKVHHAGRNCASGYGLHASPRTFGHSGFRTTVAMCDPEPGLVVCCSWNGMPGDDATHLARQNALCEAVYEDLGLVA